MLHLFTLAREHLFTFSIGTILLATLLFGETYHVYALFMLIGLLSFIVFRKTKRKSFSKPEVLIVGAWLLYLATYTVATFFSHSFVDSLHALFVQIAAFVWFVGLLFVPKKHISVVAVTVTAILVVGLIVFLSILFPALSLSDALPNTNILVARHGHNLLAGLLVLVYPLFLQFAAKKLRLGKMRLMLLVGVLSVLMILTFSRLAQVIMLAQLAGLLLASKGFEKRELASAFFTAIAFLLSVLLANIFLTFSSFSCASLPMAMQVCKPYAKELRPEYWRQAVIATKEFPVAGYSVGNFSLVSNKYSHAPQAIVKYAHNIWLEMFSTGGIFVGLSFVVLTLFLIAIPLMGIKQKKKDSSGIAIELGLIGFFFLCLIDYYWSIFGLQLFFLLFVVVLLRKLPFNRLALPTYSVLSFRVTTLTHAAFFILLLAYGSGYYFVDAKMRAGKVAQAFTVFPYYFFHKPIYFQYVGFTASKTAAARKLFIYDPEFQKLERERGEASVLGVIAPWTQLNGSSSRKLIEANKLDLAQDQLMAIQKALVGGQEKDLFIADHQTKQRVALDLLLLANSYLRQKEYVVAAKMYYLATELDSWVIDTFPDIELPRQDEHLASFILLTADIPAETFGRHRLQFSQVSADLLQFTEYFPKEASVSIAQRAIEFDPNSAQRVWSTTSQAAMKSRSKHMILTWYEVWKMLKSNGARFGYEYQEDLARELIIQGNTAAGDGTAEIGKYYSAATNIFPWAPTFDTHFLQTVSPDQLTDAQTLEYAEKMLGKRGDAIGWNAFGHAKIFARAARLSSGKLAETYLNESEFL